MADGTSKHADLRVNGRAALEVAHGSRADRRDAKGGVCRLALTDLDKQGAIWSPAGRARPA
jgi:hypothetical protein